MGKEIDLHNLFITILKKWWIVAIGALLFGVVFFLYSKLVIPEQFTSVGSLYVNSKAQKIISQEEKNNTANLYELTTADMLVDTYIKILSSNSFFEIIKERTDIPYKAGSIRKMVSYDSDENTCVISVSVVAPDAKMANKICQAVLDCANYAIMDIVEVGSVKTIDKASLPLDHSYPNRALNTFIGMVIGALAACALIFVIDYFDVRIKSVNDVREKYDLVILGVIPAIDNKEDESVEKN